MEIYGLQEVIMMDPPHEVRDQAKADAIAASIREGGWQGRPLLAIGNQLVTGSHRHAALVAVWNDGDTEHEVDVPVYIVPDEALAVAIEATEQYPDEIRDDQDMLEYASMSGDEEFLRLMQAELDARDE